MHKYHHIHPVQITRCCKHKVTHAYIEMILLQQVKTLCHHVTFVIALLTRDSTTENMKFHSLHWMPVRIIWFIKMTGEFPAQRASNGENVFIWWRHHMLRRDKEENTYHLYTLFQHVLDNSMKKITIVTNKYIAQQTGAIRVFLCLLFRY